MELSHPNQKSNGFYEESNIVEKNSSSAYWEK